jgi:hypothetical protein
MPKDLSARKRIAANLRGMEPGSKSHVIEPNCEKAGIGVPVDSSQQIPKPSLQRNSRRHCLTINLPIADLELARLFARRKGLPFPTYMKALFHEALMREAYR